MAREPRFQDCWPELTWRGGGLAELGALELHRIASARQQVFVVEQQCAYQDADELDEAAFHLAAWVPQQRLPLAYARVIGPGCKYAEPSIGRVLTTAPARGMGLGRELVRRAIAHTLDRYPGLGIRISAQSHLAAFYGEAGFVAEGEVYLEDDIPHIEMWRAG